MRLLKRLLQVVCGAALALSAFVALTQGYTPAAVVAYYDHLKTCTPYTFSYQFGPGSKFENVIKGMSGDKCHVSFLMPGPSTMDCLFTQRTIELLTSESKYREARAGKSTGSSSSEEGSRMTQECK